MSDIPVEEENHPLYFQKFEIPWVVWDMMEKKILAPREVLLLSYIDALYNPKTDECCWATNNYLADKMGVTPRQIQYMIEHLKREGLLIQNEWKITKFGRLRTLKVVVKGSHGEGGSRKKLRGGHEVNFAPSLYMSYERELGGVTRTPQAEQLAELFLDNLNLNKHNPTKYTRRSQYVCHWGKLFQQLLQYHPLPILKTIIPIHCKNTGKDYWPLALDAQSFIDKYPRIEEAYRRAYRQDIPQEKIPIEVTYEKDGHVHRLGGFVPIGGNVEEEKKKLGRKLQQHVDSMNGGKE